MKRGSTIGLDGTATGASAFEVGGKLCISIYLDDANFN
jgi:hypothetical protein